MADITPRQRAILVTVVERYIATGEPVGSATIAAALTSTSPATIRNEMVALADAGLLEQPHTSAGRIPAAFGDDDGEDARWGEAGKVDVLELVSAGDRGDGYADTGGKRGEDVGGALEDGLGTGYTEEAGVDVVAGVLEDW